MIIEFDVLLGTKSYDDLLIGSNMFPLSLSLFLTVDSNSSTCEIPEFS